MVSTVSKVKICNMALSHVGASANVESITEETVQAKACLLWYDFSLEQSLELMDWSFARKRQTLAAHFQDADEVMWAYRYQYPVDCTVFRKIENPIGLSFTEELGFFVGRDADTVPYEIQLATNGTKSILTNVQEAVGIYTKFEEDSTLYGSTFVQLLSFVLSSNIAYTLTGKNQLQAAMWEKAEEWLTRAAASNANEEMAHAPRDADTIRARD